MAPPPEMPPPRPPFHFSKTKRILLLIDLHPLLTSPNPTHYISTLTAATSRLLRFPPLSDTLFSYKFFNSTNRSTADLVTPFDLPLVTLDSLSTALNSISFHPHYSFSADAACFVQSLAQLADEYDWEEAENLNSSGMDHLIDESYTNKVPSNLVILFSAVISCNDYLTVNRFASVREAFVKKDIHLCWIDVKSDSEMNEAETDSGVNVAIFKGGIQKMGWGFCSSNLIVLGSTILPLGLIYPKIGVPFYLVDFEDSDKRKCNGALSLEILDVKGIPLECKCCDLEFVLPSCVELNAPEVGDARNQEYGQDGIFGRLGNGSIKLHVKEVHPYDELVEIQGTSEIVLVRERLLGSGEGKTGSDFFADRALEMLCEDMGGGVNGTQSPIWQMFLSFLYLNRYWASVSISSNRGATSMGTLKPLSSHIAVLSGSSHGHISVNITRSLELPKTSILSNGTCSEDVNNLNRCHSSQTEASTSGNCPASRDGKKKRRQRYMYQDMTWSSFCREAFGGSSLDLFEVFSSRKFEKSKKLKFFKCWIKQIVKICTLELTKLHGSKSLLETATCKGLLSEPSLGEKGVISFSNAETAEVFFGNITKTIQHGLESGMDLQSLAERIVKSSFRWLHQKSVTGSSLEDQQIVENSGDSCCGAVGTLMKHLLRKCKEMKKIHQNDASAANTSDHCSTPENIVREYEMQIFLRMEILVSEFSVMIEESRKQKLVKQICSLLEIMQFIVAGGLHGHISLYDYVEQTIKARYSDRLEDVVKQIYSELEMDLLLYGEEGETPSLLFNSEDINQSWRDNRLERSKIADTNSINVSLSMDNDYSQPLANSAESPYGEENFHILRAKERREKNRRFVSFTRQAPDLQRVWAPKQPKTAKYKFDPLPKKSRKKDKRGLGYSVVCETPMTGNKRTHSGENKKGDKEQQDMGKSSNTVSKALFQDS